MIAPNLTLKEKVLAGAIFLRKYAEALAEDKNPMLRISATPHCIAADAIELMAEENEKLRAQLVAFQKAANPAVAVDPAKEDSEHTCYTPLAKGTRVFLKVHPHRHGTIEHSLRSGRNDHRYYVCFDSEFEENRWVKARNLGLVPNK
ncbi:hypothetical protein F3Q63_17840 [Salmonella enterica subsp. enterica]|uniref:Uncharacterized protein n=1 Tax=Salmonella enterica I TaxID=59201 RepID=A0A612HAE6_SALET|nr:hypothetical protein [Salmonella enterica subsp. enterica]EDX6002628.1 hypothetical protein [Salmonella enterica subsp. enterica serovar Enteritidis]